MGPQTNQDMALKTLSLMAYLIGFYILFLSISQTQNRAFRAANRMLDGHLAVSIPEAKCEKSGSCGQLAAT